MFKPLGFNEFTRSYVIKLLSIHLLVLDVEKMFSKFLKRVVNPCEVTVVCRIGDHIVYFAKERQHMYCEIALFKSRYLMGLTKRYNVFINGEYYLSNFIKCFDQDNINIKCSRELNLDLNKFKLLADVYKNTQVDEEDLRRRCSLIEKHLDDVVDVEFSITKSLTESYIITLRLKIFNNDEDSIDIFRNVENRYLIDLTLSNDLEDLDFTTYVLTSSVDEKEFLTITSTSIYKRVSSVEDVLNILDKYLTNLVKLIKSMMIVYKMLNINVDEET